MMDKENTGSEILPPEEGATIYAETSLESSDLNIARTLYQRVKTRLLDVNEWQKRTGSSFAGFQLTDQKGSPVEGQAQEGALFRIDIPGPGTNSGQGFDWVSVEQIAEHATEKTESLSITVRPAPSPASQSNATAHFYGPEATSTFVVIRENNKVSVSVLDKNIKPNKKAKTSLDQIRNTLVGGAGMLLFSKLQWKKLTEGLLHD